MNNLRFKVVGVSEYHGLSKAGKPYSLYTLEVDYNGEKAKIKTFEGGVIPGDFIEVCIGLKKSVYGAELIPIVTKVISAKDIEE